MSNVVQLFNQTFIQFMDTIHEMFPNDVDIETAKNALLTAQRVNPKITVKIWMSNIVVPYHAQIAAGDIHFFLEKDYSHDVAQHGNADRILEAIDRLREPIKFMSNEQQQVAMEYIQKLTRIAMLVK